MLIPLPRAPAFSGWLLPTCYPGTEVGSHLPAAYGLRLVTTYPQQEDRVLLTPPDIEVTLPNQRGRHLEDSVYLLLHRNNTFYWLQIPPPHTARFCSRSAKAHGYCARRKWAASGEMHSVIFTPTKTQTYTPDPLYKCPANIDWNSGMRQPCALGDI